MNGTKSTISDLTWARVADVLGVQLDVNDCIKLATVMRMAARSLSNDDDANALSYVASELAQRLLKVVDDLGNINLGEAPR